MKAELLFLNSTDEIGANSIYVYLDGTGILIDAGLHPKKRNNEAFPKFELLNDLPVDLLIVTHAHTDHIGALPYLLKFQPQIQIFATEATRDLTEIMLKDTAKLLKSEVTKEFSEDALSMYKPETLERINYLLHGFKYYQSIDFIGKNGLTPLKITFYPSGHILGSASIFIEFAGKSLLFTSDVKFSNQAVIPSADLPKHHLDYLITESTNAGFPNLPSWDDEKKRLATFINNIASNNGSILIPSFALGKTQEILKVIWNLMHKNSIPRLPIFTAGLSRRISRLYDVYCYSVPMVKKGFEISDIPQEIVIYDELFKGKYFKESSIVVVPSGMMNIGTLSNKLASRWMKHPNFGIGFVGYLEEDSPGYQVMNSEKGVEFQYGLTSTKRSCEVEKFRFSSHASLDELLNYAGETTPKQIYVVHGDINSANNLAFQLQSNLKKSRIFLPSAFKFYNLE